MRWRRRFRWFLALLTLWVPALSMSASAQSDHRLHWRSLQTPHFRLHYHEPLGVLARVVAAEAEAVHERVSQALQLSITQPVELVVSDESDAANGLASGIPYNVIRLRAAAPDDLSPLAD